MSAFGNTGLTQQPAQRNLFGNRKPRGGVFTGQAFSSTRTDQTGGTPFAAARQSPAPVTRLAAYGQGAAGPTAAAAMPPNAPRQRQSQAPSRQEYAGSAQSNPLPPTGRPAYSETPEMYAAALRQREASVRRATGTARDQAERDEWTRDELGKMRSSGQSYWQPIMSVEGAYRGGGDQLFMANSGGRMLALPTNRWGQILDPSTGRVIGQSEAKALAASQGQPGDVSLDTLRNAQQFGTEWDRQLDAVSASARAYLNGSLAFQSDVGKGTDLFQRGITVGEDGMPTFTGGPQAQQHLAEAHRAAQAYGLPKDAPIPGIAGAQPYALAALFAANPRAKQDVMGRVASSGALLH